MGQRLAPISRVRLIQRFKNLGWEGPFKGSSHPHWAQGFSGGVQRRA